MIGWTDRWSEGGREKERRTDRQIRKEKDRQLETEEERTVRAN